MAQPSELTSAEPPHAAHDNMSAGSIEVIKTSKGDVLSALAEELESAARRIRKRLKNMSASVIEIGRELRAAKQHLEHGHFLDWVEKECRLSARTAQLIMRAAEWAAGKCEIVAHLEPAAIYLLAAPSTPETVRQEVLSRLEEGQTPATQRVKDMIRATKGYERTPRERNGRRDCSGQQYNDRSAHPRSEPKQGELQQPQDWGPIGGELAAATTELIEMLLAWDRFDEFTALLKDADIFSFVQTLKDHCGSLDTGAVDKAVTDTGQILLVSHEAAAHDRVGEAARLPPQGVSADVATYDPGHAEAEAVSAIVAPEPSANVSAEALLEIFSLLGPNSQWRGRDWVADGCPTVIRPDEHFIIAENLAPFRDTARNASPTERQRFLDMTAPQMTGRAEEAA